jgi:hypothetical protein
MTDLTPNDLSHLSDEEFNALCPQGEHAPGPEPLSPAAQAIVKAFDDRYELLGPLEDDWQEQCLAAALRAAADQVVPKEVFNRRGMRPGGTGSIAPDEFKQDQRFETRCKLLAIATELEGPAQ